MVKPKSQSAAGRAQATPEQIEKLAGELAEKDYGRPKEKPSDPEKKSQAIGISLPPDMIEKLQDMAIKNKRGGAGQKTVSGIIRELLEREGY
jgi:hypothetical protein